MGEQHTHRSGRVADGRAKNHPLVHPKAAPFGKAGHLVMARARNPLAAPIRHCAATHSDARRQSSSATEGIYEIGRRLDHGAHSAHYSDILNGVNAGMSEYDLGVYAGILKAARCQLEGLVGMDGKQEMGLRMVAARAVQNVSQAAAARHLGISASKLANWESGAHSPDRDALNLFCDIYEVPTDWVLRGRTPGVPPDRAADLRRTMDGLTRERGAERRTA